MAINKYFTGESLELFVDKIKEYTDNAVSSSASSCTHEELTNEQIDAILGPLDGGSDNGSGESSSGSSDLITDATLTQSGMAADAKATGDAIANIKLNMVKSINGTKPDNNGDISISSIDGANGKDGEDGISPTISVTSIVNGNRISITDVNGTNYVDVMNGTNGKDGVNGKDGINGANGTDGTNGEDGVTYTPSVDFEGNLSWSNDKGFVNPMTINIRGKDGQDGVNGTDGKSAYEVALSNGYVGTESEWLLSLRGLNGDDGINGENGQDGLTPYIGDNGNWWIGATDTGKPSRGDKGDTGATGPTYTLTSSDKNIIVNSVLAALPTWTGGTY